MKALIIGFGSIGKRHYEILSCINIFQSVDVITKQSIKNNDFIIYKELSDIQNISRYDYFVIASETSKHYQQLKYICSKVNNKKIVVEKPLFDKKHDTFTHNNKIFTAYNLRFHPVIEKLRYIIKDETVYYVNVICGQYLPSWRPGQDYKRSYSANLSKGGGVLRDLSHELDYLIWLFGDIKIIHSINTKISSLDINSDDIFTAIAITNCKSIINLTVDYISKVPIRQLVIHTENNTIQVDIINNQIIIYDKRSNIRVIEPDKKDRNYSYTRMHKSIINDEFTTVCSFDEGMKIVDIINSIKFMDL